MISPTASNNLETLSSSALALALSELRRRLAESPESFDTGLLLRSIDCLRRADKQINARDSVSSRRSSPAPSPSSNDDSDSTSLEEQIVSNLTDAQRLAIYNIINGSDDEKCNGMKGCLLRAIIHGVRDGVE